MRKGSHFMLYALIVLIVILVLLFALAKVAFWITLLIVLVLFGIWLYQHIQHKKKVSTETTYGESRLY